MLAFARTADVIGNTITTQTLLEKIKLDSIRELRRVQRTVHHQELKLCDYSNRQIKQLASSSGIELVHVVLKPSRHYLKTNSKTLSYKFTAQYRHGRNRADHRRFQI